VFSGRCISPYARALACLVNATPVVMVPRAADDLLGILGVQEVGGIAIRCAVTDREHRGQLGAQRPA